MKKAPVVDPERLSGGRLGCLEHMRKLAFSAAAAHMISEQSSKIAGNKRRKIAGAALLEAWPHHLGGQLRVLLL